MEELPPQFPQRHSLSGAFSAPALAPAGARERRGGLPGPLAPLSCPWGRPGGRGSRVRGTPTRGLVLRSQQFRAGLGSSRAARFRFGAGFPITVPCASPIAVGPSWFGGHPSHPARRRVLSAASRRGSRQLSQLKRVARSWVGLGLLGPGLSRVRAAGTPPPRAPTPFLRASVSTALVSHNLRCSLGACFPALSSNRIPASRGAV